MILNHLATITTSIQYSTYSVCFKRKCKNISQYTTYCYVSKKDNLLMKVKVKSATKTNLRTK